MRSSIKTLDKLNVRLKGYCKTFKGKYLLLQNKYLTDEEFVLWDFSSYVLADWDKKNRPEQLGVFLHSYEEIALMLSWSPAKVSRKGSNLIAKGLWEKHSTGGIKVRGYEVNNKLAELTKDKKPIDLQEYLSILQPTNAKLQENTRSISPIKTSTEGKNNIDNLSKDALGIPFKDEYIRTEKDYIKIWEEMGCPNDFTTDDMKWIDVNVAENNNVFS